MQAIRFPMLALAGSLFVSTSPAVEVHVFGVRSADVRGRSNVRLSNTPELLGISPTLKHAAPEDGGTPLSRYVEDFAGDPSSRGWQSFGDATLFHWNAANQNLEVTWDSARTNSYFYRPLGTVLARSDDFSLAFDLRLSDIAIGTNPGKPSTFQLAVGFLKLSDATSTNFLRGTGTDPLNGPRNLAEFNYFPDSGFGATVSPTLISTNREYATSFNFPLPLVTNAWFHIAMTYTASNHTLTTAMTRNGEAFGPIQDVELGTNFSDFRANAVAIASYSDAGQSPPEFAGSLLAHGVVDNLAVSVPPPPVAKVGGSLTGGQWQVQFGSRTNWLYMLEGTADFIAWTNIAIASGTGDNLTLTDTNAAGAAVQFYRVKAERP